ncbi:MAG: SRPBCC family protein [Gammaproteobacteria bacterium]|nr:SRPBCC family protein [Gammaproteobacteria bacterium]
MQFSEEIRINAPCSVIFSIYSKVNEWPNWDPDVAEASLFGSFSQGAKGKLKPSDGPKTKIRLTEVVENKAFTVCSNLPLCKIIFEHDLEALPTSTRVIHRVSFRGPLKHLFSHLIGPKIRQGLPESLKGLKLASEKYCSD